MSQAEIDPNLVVNTADLFLFGGEEVFTLRRYKNRAYPITYSAYDLGAAAVEAMFEAGFSPEDVGKNITLKEQVKEEAKELIEDWEKIESGRRAQAQILNNYSHGRSFNPN